ncbi:MAG: beta-ketoacyl synthase N-terminal-like domain-containing protein, partial [Myxococcales bacterium]|nr:beta-ketoacyl synthase N-terminal-like domain-containing protein [Myxococcales bacterium]
QDRSGFGTVTPAQGVALFVRAIQVPTAHLLPVPVRTAVLRAAHGQGAAPLWRELLPKRRGMRAPGKGAWTREVAELPPGRREAEVVGQVREQVARVMSLPGAGSVDPSFALRDLGMDSVMALDLRRILSQRTGEKLPATLVFDYPTPVAIARYLLRRVEGPAGAGSSPAAVETPMSADEAIAIVGVGCRYPGGVTDLDSFWQLLDGGVDAVSEIPAERWDVDAIYDPDPDAVGKMMTRSGGFLAGVDRFDPGFFGIAPREAIHMDPQQRLLLETSWEALERAGIAPDRLSGTPTGVFVGLMYNDYYTLTGDDLARLDGYVGMGSSHSVASGRISYSLGLVGPSMTVDTACSSSLVTVHLACQALRNRECSLALAGGAALMLSPAGLVEFSRLRGLSPDGRCKSFSAAADGAGWSEGCAMLALERLSDARRNGHPVLAVVRGSAVNQDGRSNGLSAPNGPSQEEVIGRALAQASVHPAEVQYVECHGTGTSLGDPIEVQALGAALGTERPADRPVVIGSVKSNFGHTQAAAGAAGLIKTMLAMRHGRIPKNLHFDQPSPHIPWDELPVRVASQAMAWPDGSSKIAGVSSFGISGTNAHVILEEPPPDMQVEAPAARGPELFLLSGKVPEAVAASAENLRAHLVAHPDISYSAVASTLATGRTHHEQRVAFVADSREALLERLRLVSEGEPCAAILRSDRLAEERRIAFAFTGAGAEWLGMGRSLLAQEGAFRTSMQACDEALQREAGWSVLEELAAGPEVSRLRQVEILQPTLFAMGVSLAALFRSLGVEPSVVIGHSQGEVAAACVAGALSLSQGVAIVCRRSRLVRRLIGRGEMAVIGMSEEQAEAALLPYAGRLSVAGLNSARLTVVSGDSEPLQELLERLDAEGVFFSLVQADFAGHSAQVDELRDELLADLGTIVSVKPHVPMVSTVTGTDIAEGELSAEYWADNLRQPVRLSSAMARLIKDGHRVFVEVGAHPVLLPALEESCSDHDVAGVVVGTLRRDRSERECVLSSLGRLFAAGCEVDWAAVFPHAHPPADLPTYPWQRQRYWTDPVSVAGSSRQAAEHPLLGARVSVAGTAAVYESAFSPIDQAWMDGHRVSGRPLVAGATIAELIRAGGEEHFGGQPVELRSLVLQSPLWLSAEGAQRAQLVLREEDGRCDASVYGYEDEAWVLKASAEVQPMRASLAGPPQIELAPIAARCDRPLAIEDLYAAAEVSGVEYTGAFRGLRALRIGDGEVLGEVRAPEGLEEGPYGVHPALLDAAFQTSAGLTVGEDGMLPFAMERFVLYEPGWTAGTVWLRHKRGESGGTTVDLALCDEHGRVAAEVVGLRLQATDLSALAREGRDMAQDLYCVSWAGISSRSGEDPVPSGSWALLGEATTLRAALAERISATGATCTCVTWSESDGVPAADNVVCLWPGGGEEPSDVAVQVAARGLGLVQTLAVRPQPPRLYWVTCEGVAVSPGDSAAEAAGALWGLGRTVMQEHPELQCTLLDIEAGESGLQALLRELSWGDDENQIVWRQGKRHVARLSRSPASRVPEGNYALQIARKGMLDQLRAAPVARREVGPGEVEIEVRASGLNFRDVLNALG